MIVTILLVSILAAVLGAGLVWRQRGTQALRKQQVVDHRLNDELEQRVKDRTVQLEASNRELEAFCYSVSHDLRAPLRGIDGWSLALLEDYRDKLDEKGRQQLQRVRAETQRMGRLIDDLLKLSHVARGSLERSRVDLTAMAQSAAARLQEAEPERRVEFAVQPGLTAQGDARLLNVALSNLLANAWKFSRACPLARVEFGRAEVAGRPAFFVRDNGVGFDMTYAQKLFGAFQRLHKASEFPGTGIGLATVQRVIQRHGGRVWAEAQVDRGATFYFTLEEAV
jgi:light-regulated signal transduction histidine kinase (bacteriophytochrome)